MIIAGRKNKKNKTNKKEDRKKYVLIFVICFFLLILVVSLILNNLIKPIYTLSVSAHVKVDDYVGINLDTDKLYFGTVSPGSSGRRGFSITAPFDSFVVIKEDGLLGDWLISPEKSFYLYKNDSKFVSYAVTVPDETPFKNYTSNISINFYRPIVGVFS